jgi:phosphomannomutase/4-hydroxy-L-threonine phosphate dehydrogenase PdxA
VTRTIGITLGEPCGIGPELVIRSLAKGPPADARIVVYGSPALLEATASDLGIEPFWGESSQAAVRIVPCGPDPKGGHFDTDDLRARAEATLVALDAGSADALAHRTHALVTAPIDKSVVRRLVPGFTGHTRYLAEKAGVERTIMLLDNTEIRVVLVTEHIPLREVPARVTQEELKITVRTTAEAFRKWFGKPKLRVAVAGLSPHAGEIVERSEEEVVMAPGDWRLERSVARGRGAVPRRFDLLAGQARRLGLRRLPLPRPGAGGGEVPGPRQGGERDARPSVPSGLPGARRGVRPRGVGEGRSAEFLAGDPDRPDRATGGNMTEIKFGTDGWRALIARDYTFDNVALVSHAVAETMKEKAPDRKKMVVGYDRRFLSRAFAEATAAVFASHGYEALLAETFLPTPAISWAAKNEPGVAGATMITASHNPPDWNGYKFKETFGGSARPELTKEFEKRIVALAGKTGPAPTREEYEKLAKAGKIRPYNPRERYFDAVRKMIDVDLIRKSKARIGLDVMYGAASGHYVELLRSVGVEALEIHGDDNPGFGGTPPEPIGKNLTELCALVKKNRFACGLATDGDADRLGAVDEEGNYFTTQQILSVVYWHMLRNRGKRWSIARSASTTRMVDLIAARAGFKAHETPVGFKYIADKMVNGEAQIGGEESGGIGILDHNPERDGPLTGLLLLEIVAATGKGLKAIYDDLCREERPYYFVRHDLHLSEAQAETAVGKLKSAPPKSWDGRPVETLSLIDGHKFYLADGGWVLIRKSGTEPIFRLYAEAESEAASQKLVDAARKFVEGR